MTILDSLHVAIANVRANLVRSFLSMLGIVIGTGAVIVVVSIVNGTRVATMESMMAGTADLLYLRPSFSDVSGRAGKITMDDVERLKRLPDVVSALPDLSHRMDVRGSRGKANAQLLGIDAIYAALFKLELVTGRFLESLDIERRHRVCLISDVFARKLFENDYPVGQKIRSEDLLLEVVGVVKAKERSLMTASNADIYVPLPLLLRMMGNPQIYSVAIRSDKGKIDRVKSALQELIQMNPQQAGLLELSDPRDYMKEMAKWARLWMLQMILIAGISLLVGGVGLMNVMLTTVAERTHEIGLRKALGASSRMVMHQFLIEAATLSGLGGLLGVGSGVFISYALNLVSGGKILVAIPPLAVFVSFFFSLFLGLVFGLFPASKAAHLSPVEALRYE